MDENIQEITVKGVIADRVSIEPKPKRSRKDVAKDMELLKREDIKLQYHEQNLSCAEQVFDLYECYIEAGFDEEQAWTLIIEQIKTLKK